MPRRNEADTRFRPRITIEFDNAEEAARLKLQAQKLASEQGEKPNELYRRFIRDGITESLASASFPVEALNDAGCITISGISLPAIHNETVFTALKERLQEGTVLNVTMTDPDLDEENDFYAALRSGIYELQVAGDPRKKLRQTADRLSELYGSVKMANMSVRFNNRELPTIGVTSIEGLRNSVLYVQDFVGEPHGENPIRKIPFDSLLYYPYARQQVVFCTATKPFLPSKNR